MIFTFNQNILLAFSLKRKNKDKKRIRIPTNGEVFGQKNLLKREKTIIKTIGKANKIISFKSVPAQNPRPPKPPKPLPVLPLLYGIFKKSKRPGFTRI